MELLSPAGDLLKLQYALAYGADAVYASGTGFGLRTKSRNFTDDGLISAVEYTHNQGKKIYITVNIFAHNQQIADLKNYLIFLSHLQIDALIISDPGVFNLARQYAGNLPIHISTQANVTNWSSVLFWRDAGAKRIILARELSIDEISEISQHVPDIELEMFVHGAMCMSYSGRCLLSAYLNGRHANLGDCSQPCRWEFYLKEKSRPDEEFVIEEDEQGTYILNSRDLCLLDRLPQIMAAGVDSIKIEGRMKSLYYAANVTRIYKEAMKAIETGKEICPQLREELTKVSHRVYCEGFFYGLTGMNKQYYESSAYIRNFQFLGEVINSEPGWLIINVKARFQQGEEIDLITPERQLDSTFIVKIILNEDSEQISFTKPNTVVKIGFDSKCPAWGILRKKIKKC
jgi:U32 family peptidase